MCRRMAPQSLPTAGGSSIGTTSTTPGHRTRRTMCRRARAGLCRQGAYGQPLKITGHGPDGSAGHRHRRVIQRVITRFPLPHRAPGSGRPCRPGAPPPRRVVRSNRRGYSVLSPVSPCVGRDAPNQGARSDLSFLDLSFLDTSGKLAPPPQPGSEPSLPTRPVQEELIMSFEPRRLYRLSPGRTGPAGSVLAILVIIALAASVAGSLLTLAFRRPRRAGLPRPGSREWEVS